MAQRFETPESQKAFFEPKTLGETLGDLIDESATETINNAIQNSSGGVIHIPAGMHVVGSGNKYSQHSFGNSIDTTTGSGGYSFSGTLDTSGGKYWWEPGAANAQEAMAWLSRNLEVDHLQEVHKLLTEFLDI